jgi:dolichyl-phosphate beta-glucosyltransferase
MSLAGPLALGSSDLFLATIFGAAVFLGTPLVVIGRRQAVVAMMTGIATRFPGHLSKRVPTGVERTLESFRSTLHLPATAALLLLTSIAWGFECLGARWVFESLGTEIDVFLAVGTVVVTHLGIVLLPAAMGFGATELLGVMLLGYASPSVRPLLAAILLYHVGVVLWTRALPRVLGVSDPALPGPARVVSASSAARHATARRRVVDEFVSSARPNSGPWLSFVIPAYNEERRIVSTLLSVTTYLRARRIPSEIVVVDDGSFDGTARLVEEFAREHPEVRLLRKERNLGKGAAVRTGMLAARGGWRIFSDADGSTPIEEVERLLAAAAGGATVVIGSRAIGSEDTRTERRLGRAVVGRIFAFFVNWWAVPGIADTQCGFKLFDRRSAEWIFERQRLDDFAFDVEILFLAQRHGLEIVEVPVNWSNVAGSKVDLLRDSSRMLWAVARMRKMHRSTASDGG